MKAVQFKFTGDSENVDIPKPSPAEDELLVKVVYSALDTSVWTCLRKEWTAYFIHKVKEPLYLGYHYAGKVEEVGSDVTDLAKGTDLFGFLQCEPSQTQGSLAEFITVKRQDCAVLPSGISFDTAAASAIESITALQAMRDLGGLQKGHSILIVGAAGGVGSAAVQIAKNLGATVTAVCSDKDVDKVKKWGADTVVDRSSNPDYVHQFAKDSVQFDVILDAPNVLPASATKLLKPQGALVSTVPTMAFLWAKLKTLFSSKKVSYVECRSKEEDLNLVGKWLKEGTLDIPIDSIFKVKDIQDAMVKQDGKKNGRVVIQVENGWT